MRRFVYRPHQAFSGCNERLAVCLKSGDQHPALCHARCAGNFARHRPSSRSWVARPRHERQRPAGQFQKRAASARDRARKSMGALSSPLRPQERRRSSSAALTPRPMGWLPIAPHHAKPDTEGLSQRWQDPLRGPGRSQVRTLAVGHRISMTRCVAPPRFFLGENRVQSFEPSRPVQSPLDRIRCRRRAKSSLLHPRQYSRLALDHRAKPFSSSTPPQEFPSYRRSRRLMTRVKRSWGRQTQGGAVWRTTMGVVRLPERPSEQNACPRSQDRPDRLQPLSTIRALSFPRSRRWTEEFSRTAVIKTNLNCRIAVPATMSAMICGKAFPLGGDRISAAHKS
jgi:hypothetical protein